MVFPIHYFLSVPERNLLFASQFAETVHVLKLVYHVFALLKNNGGPIIKQEVTMKSSSLETGEHFFNHWSFFWHMKSYPEYMKLLTQGSKGVLTYFCLLILYTGELMLL